MTLFGDEGRATHGQTRLLRNSRRHAHRDRSGDEGAYRKLAMKWHPDRNPGDKDCEAQFKEINEAYDVLKDGQKRAAYDRFGHAAFEQGGGGQGPGFGADFASTFSDIFEDLFSWAAGAARRRPRARRGPALQHGDHARGSLCRQDRAGAHPDLGHLRGVLRRGRQGRLEAEDLPDLRRRRARCARPKASSRSSAPASPARGAAR